MVLHLATLAITSQDCLILHFYFYPTFSYTNQYSFFHNHPFSNENTYDDKHTCSNIDCS